MMLGDVNTSAGGEPACTVIVSSYNRPMLLSDALLSVVTEAIALGRVVQILVADDWSTDPGVSYLVRQYGALMVRPARVPTTEERHHGQRCAVAINDVLPLIRAPYVTFLPDDDFLYPGSLACRVAYLDQHPEAHCVYGRLEACAPMTGLPRPGRHHLPPEADTQGRAWPMRVSEGGDHCVHDRNGFWQAEPLGRAANVLDHSMVMVRWGEDMPTWPETRTAESEAGEVVCDQPGQTPAALNLFAIFDCPDAGWFYRLERAGKGPFYSVPDVVTVKRYHAYGHRSGTDRRE